MSMDTYGFHEFGLILAPEICAYIMKFDDEQNRCVPDTVWDAVNDGNFNRLAASEDPSLPQDYRNPALAQEALEAYGIDVVYCSEFTGLAAALDNTKTASRVFKYDDAYMACLVLNRPSNPLSASYADLDEIITELRDRLTVDNKPILPANLDIRPFICEITGVYIA